MNDMMKMCESIMSKCKSQFNSMTADEKSDSKSSCQGTSKKDDECCSDSNTSSCSL